MKSVFFVLAFVFAFGTGVSLGTAAQKGGGGMGGSMGFNCGGGVCTCTGDVDCNDMFSGGTCPGDPRDKCDEGADGVSRCSCYTTPARTTVPPKLVPKAGGAIKMAPAAQ